MKKIIFVFLIVQILTGCQQVHKINVTSLSEFSNTIKATYEFVDKVSIVNSAIDTTLAIDVDEVKSYDEFYEIFVKCRTFLDENKVSLMESLERKGTSLEEMYVSFDMDNEGKNINLITFHSQYDMEKMNTDFSVWYVTTFSSENLIEFESKVITFED